MPGFAPDQSLLLPLPVALFDILTLVASAVAAQLNVPRHVSLRRKRQASCLRSKYALLLPLPLSILFGLAFVMLLFAFGEADLELDPAVLEMQIERYEGVTGALDFADQTLEFSGVQQQLSRASRIGLNVRGSGGQGSDMSANEVQTAIFHDDIRLGDLRATCPDGLGFPPT